MDDLIQDHPNTQMLNARPPSTTMDTSQTETTIIETSTIKTEMSHINQNNINHDHQNEGEQGNMNKPSESETPTILTPDSNPTSPPAATLPAYSPPDSVLPSLKRCELCSRFRRVPLSIALAASSWSCSDHPDETVASCDFTDEPPLVVQPGKLVHYHSLPANPPYNFTLLGILPFDDVFYSQHYSHPNWTKHETLWLLQRLREEGPEAIELISRDPLLFHHQRDGCEARFFHILTLAALYQQSISTLAMPYNPYIQPITIRIEQPAPPLAVNVTPAKEPSNAPQVYVPATYAEKVQQRQLELTMNKQRKITANSAKRKKDREREREERYDRSEPTVVGTRTSGRFAGQKRKTYANEDTSDEEFLEEDDEEEDRRVWKQNPEIEFLWKIERILAERKRIVRLDAEGKPILDESSSSESESEDEEKNGTSDNRQRDTTDLEYEKEEGKEKIDMPDQNGSTSSTSSDHPATDGQTKNGITEERDDVHLDDTATKVAAPSSSHAASTSSSSSSSSDNTISAASSLPQHNTSSDRKHHHHRHRRDGSSASTTEPLHSPRKIRLHREHSTDSAIVTGHHHDMSSLALNDPNTAVITEYLVKIENQSYLHVEWHTRESLVSKFGDRNASERIARYNKIKTTQEAQNLDRYGGEPFDPRFVIVDRIIASDIITLEDENLPTPSNATNPVPEGERKIEMFFVKWSGLSYSQCTWETAEDIADELKIAQYRRFNRPSTTSSSAPTYTQEEFLARRDHWYKESPIYKGKNQLRDYQVQGLNWLIKAWYDDRNCILADEMGLGKTVQCVTLFEHLRRVEYIQGPFLVVVPLGTISHWKKEVESWTDMNVVIYHDVIKGRETRDVIREYEFYYPNTKRIKFNILVTTYEILIADIDILMQIPFKLAVIDEGHRLKNKSSKILESLKLLKCNRRLLMTGTPIQNNTGELWTLLNFLEPDLFASAVKFEEKFGHLLESDQVSALQARIRPFVLRRMKEAVEKSIPPKEETIIDIELTIIQKKYYRAIYERNLQFLRQGVNKSNMPRLVNIEIELRKACNHPFLISGAEDKELPSNCTDEQYMQILVAASGKMVLLDKLLPKMLAEHHRVLIFSQFVSVLDIVEEYCNWKKYNYERLDGGVRGNEREAAIDRFTNPNSNRFIFLLSTRAGGVGLNLAAADTVIIFDSDWNPQQDMQAQARAHRIGQKNKVMIYRLVTRNTYESQMFVRASKKLGLDHAVLTNLELDRAVIDSEDDRASIDKILRLGAYGLFDESGDAASKEFEESAIEEILQKHAHVVTFNKGSERDPEGNAEAEEGNGDADASPSPTVDQPSSLSSHAANQFRLNYHKMRFSSEKNDLDVNDQHFWEKIMRDSNLQLTLPPDELLSQLTDASAYESTENKQKFITHLTRTVDSILTAKRNGEEPPEVDALIGLLIQFAATPAFREERDQANTWLDEAQKRGERKTRAKTRDEELERGRARDDRGTRHRRRSGMKDEDEDEVADGRKSRGEDSDFSASDGSSGYDEAEARPSKLGGRVRGRSGAVMNNELCSICWQSGSLLGCDGPCDRWFHLACLNMDSPPEEQVPWLCEDCAEKKHTCRICNIRDADDNVGDQGVRCCSVPHCGMFYHLSCVKKHPLTNWYTDSPNSSFKCPSHYCYRCALAGADLYYVHCWNCPNALHVKCMGRNDIRIAKKYVICADCIDTVRATERGAAAIEASKIHSQAPPVRAKVKLKKPRKGVKNPGARRISKKQWAAMTEEEKEAETRRREQVKKEARERQKQRRIELRKQRQQAAGDETETDMEEDDDESNDETDLDSASPHSSRSGSEGAESGIQTEPDSPRPSSSLPGSETESDSDRERRNDRPHRFFAPGMWTIRFKLDGVVQYESDKQLMFLATGKRSTRNENKRERRKKKHNSRGKGSSRGRKKQDESDKPKRGRPRRDQQKDTQIRSAPAGRGRKRMKIENASGSLPKEEGLPKEGGLGQRPKSAAQRTLKIRLKPEEIKKEQQMNGELKDAEGDLVMQREDHVGHESTTMQNGIDGADHTVFAGNDNDDTDEEDMTARYPVYNQQQGREQLGRLSRNRPKKEEKEENKVPDREGARTGAIMPLSYPSPTSFASLSFSSNAPSPSSDRISSAHLTGVRMDADAAPVKIRVKLRRTPGGGDPAAASSPRSPAYVDISSRDNHDTNSITNAQSKVINPDSNAIKAETVGDVEMHVATSADINPSPSNTDSSPYADPLSSTQTNSSNDR